MIGYDNVDIFFSALIPFAGDNETEDTVHNSENYSVNNKKSQFICQTSICMNLSDIAA